MAELLEPYCSGTAGDFTPFKMAFSMIVGGPTSCGKTHFVKDLLCYLRQVERQFLHVTMFYGTDQRLFDEMGLDEKYQGLNEFVSVVDRLQQLDTWHKGQPKPRTRVQNVIIVDDLMNEVTKRPEVADVITRGISHQGLTIILIYQNLLPQQKYARTIGMNIHYRVQFYNYQTAGQFKAVVQQMESGKKTLLDMYRELGKEEEGERRCPLVIDCLRHLAWYGLEPECVVDLHDKP